MKLYAKILPKYFELLVSGKKHTDFRQFEDIIFENTETGDTITFAVKDVCGAYPHSDIRNAHPDVDWHPNRPIYKIILGRRL